MDSFLGGKKPEKTVATWMSREVREVSKNGKKTV